MNPYEQPEAPQGYPRPPSAYEAAVPRFTLEDDPLVPDSRLGISGWFGKLGGVLRRGWPLIPLIFGVTHLVPGVLSTGGLFAIARPRVPREALIGAIAGLVVLVLLAQLLGYAAATYAATRQAAGYEVRLGEALSYGLRRCLGLTGWTLLAGLLAGGAITVVAGCGMAVLSDEGVIVALPIAVYALFATAMVGPAYLFERRRPLTRSLHLLHGAFGRMAGRLLIVGLLLVAGQVVALAVGSVAPEVAGVAPTAPAAVLAAIIELPVAILVFSGILVTYAERVGGEGRTTTDLAGQL